MQEAVHTFFIKPGLGGLLVCIVIVVLVTTYVNVALWIKAGADVKDSDEQ